MEWEITVKKYRSPIPEELRWRNWAADTEGLTGDGLLDFINNKLFPSLKGLSPEASPRTESSTTFSKTPIST